MAINQNFIAIFDYETGGRDPEKCEAIQLACIMVDPRTLKAIDKFESMIRALEPDNLEEMALIKNGKTKEQIASAPHPKEVYGQFINWVKRYKKGSNAWGAPIPCGHNILGFDIPLLKRDLKTYKFEYPFHTMLIWDTLQILSMWFENTREPQRLNMDELRNFFGMSAENAHDALKDCDDVHQILCRFLNTQRKLATQIEFKGSLKPKKAKGKKDADSV